MVAADARRPMVSSVPSRRFDSCLAGEMNTKSTTETCDADERRICDRTTDQNLVNGASLLVENILEPEEGREPTRAGIISMTVNFICPHCGGASTASLPETPSLVVVQATSAAVQTTPADEWWETERAAAYLRLTPKTVREGVVKGTLPGHKYPAGSSRGRWRFKKAELDRFLNKRPSPRRTVAETIWN